MKGLKFIAFISLAFFISACSSKVQTNKIPDEKKYILPYNTQGKEVKINTQNQKSFEEALRAFFKVKDEEQENIYDIGLKRGHFIQKD